MRSTDREDALIRPTQVRYQEEKIDDETTGDREAHQFNHIGKPEATTVIRGTQELFQNSQTKNGPSTLLTYNSHLGIILITSRSKLLKKECHKTMDYKHCEGSPRSLKEPIKVGSLCYFHKELGSLARRWQELCGWSSSQASKNLMGFRRSGNLDPRQTKGIDKTCNDVHQFLIYPSDILNQTIGCSFLSSLDTKKAYHQIVIVPEDVHKMIVSFPDVPYTKRIWPFREH